MESFAHLARLEDGGRKVQDAELAVAELGRLVRTNRMVDEEAEHKAKREKRESELRETDAFRRRLGEIRSLFAQVAANTDNPQQRGRDLEKVMRDVFELFDLDPKASFSLRGEQIDGAFTLDGTDYIFEAKWEKELIDRDDLDVLAQKVSRRLDNTLGLFLSMSSFQPTAVELHSNNRSTIYLMEGPDLAAVLEERIDFVEMLRRKRRHAAETGNVFLPIYPALLAEQT